MSAKPNEGNPEEDGGANANSTPLSTPSQPLEANFSEVMANLQRKIDAQQGEINALKGGKDGALDRIEKNQKDTFARIAKYLDVDVEVVRKAQRELALDDLVSERLNNPQPAQPIAGTVAKQGASVELQVIDQMLELPANDPRVTDLKLKYGNDPVEYGKAALALKGSLPTNEPTPAEQPLPTGSAPRPTVVDTATKIARLAELQKQPTKYKAEINKLYEELDKADWK